MGILNITPDSFSDGGCYTQVSEAIDRAARLIQEGADILDVGGESTRPGAVAVSIEEERERVLPVVEALSARFDVPISIDTYKAAVAEAAVQVGAAMINDVWGAKADPRMAEVAAQYDVPIVLMHNRETAGYKVLLSDMKADLQESIHICRAAGVRDDAILLDPGIGFAKTYADNIQVMRHLEEIVALGYPVVLGTSRKSFIGQTLGLPVDERVEGTGATVCLGIAKGCSIVRVHDVRAMKRMVQMMDAMMGRVS
ncbi:dihydropteroate synthase [Shouchella lonarensis]|uniref:Dihydropteroate synthase n=1 Tax=Shouchella lonarensis TaxID=1464122 RepID=A0A1G6NU04_9BACI|nr:dihydropteroate synthase [Shouchella lonarensis]SDC71413.1 Dihydropteroate synthase [Shouchella lonarensis]